MTYISPQLITWETLLGVVCLATSLFMAWGVVVHGEYEFIFHGVLLAGLAVVWFRGGITGRGTL